MYNWLSNAKRIFFPRHEKKHGDLHVKPGFLIIGGQKCVTTSLYNYLAQHPAIRPSKTKEIHFFDQNEYYSKGYGWYHEHFPIDNKNQKTSLSFEATPSYVFYPKCASRIFEYNPKIKLIIILRDPIERAYSPGKCSEDLRTIKFIIILLRNEILKKRL